MAWIQIRLNSTNEKAEKISDFLEEIGSGPIQTVSSASIRFIIFIASTIQSASPTLTVCPTSTKAFASGLGLRYLESYQLIRRLGNHQ
jgi:ribosomal protein L11 methylase PrmA